MYRKIKKLLYIWAFFDSFMLIYPLYAIMFADNGLSAAQISSLFIAWSLTGFLLEVPSGSVADKYPRRTVLLYAALVRAVGYGFWLLMPNYTGYLIGFILWGVHTAFTSGTWEALTFDELKKYKQSHDYARVTGRLSSLELLALVLSSLAASIFARHGYNLIIILSTVAVIISAIAIYLLPKAVSVESTEETKYFEYLKEGIKLVTSNTKILFIIVFAAVVTGLSASDEYYNLFFKEKGFSNTWITIIISITLAFGAAGSWLAYKLEHRRVPLTAALLTGAGLLLATTLLPPVLSPITLGLYVAFIYMVDILFNTYLQKELVDKTRATATSVKGLATEVFALISFGVFALTGGHGGYGRGFQVVAGMLLLAAIVYAVLNKKYRLG